MQPLVAEARVRLPEYSAWLSSGVFERDFPDLNRRARQLAGAFGERQRRDAQRMSVWRRRRMELMSAVAEDEELALEEQEAEEEDELPTKQELVERAQRKQALEAMPELDPDLHTADAQDGLPPQSWLRDTLDSLHLQLNSLRARHSGYKLLLESAAVTAEPALAALYSEPCFNATYVKPRYGALGYAEDRYLMQVCALRNVTQFPTDETITSSNWTGIVCVLCCWLCCILVVLLCLLLNARLRVVVFDRSVRVQSQMCTKTRSRSVCGAGSNRPPPALPLHSQRCMRTATRVGTGRAALCRWRCAAAPPLSSLEWWKTGAVCMSLN